MARNVPLKIGITIGDPAGIGPEITAKAVNSLEGSGIIPVVIGRKDIYYSGLIHDRVQLTQCVYSDNLKSINYPSFVHINTSYPLPVPGRGTVETGAESLKYIDAAIDLWKKGLIDAVVTGPVSKGLIESSGTPFSGHTEYIAAAIGESDPLMMMYSPQYRVLLVTTHLPVSRISGSVTLEKILSTVRRGAEAMRSIDGMEPVIAISGIDPHCGDNGSIGNFDRDVTAKAVSLLRDEGINIEGPFSADTLFMPDKWKKYSFIVVHYHDQGLIPFKMLAFDNGVNVTLGLSIVRTSVDHGTAFDIAGKNIAGFSSLVEAVKLAAMMARRSI